jgi:hypothetical protein
MYTLKGRNGYEILINFNPICRMSKKNQLLQAAHHKQLKTLRLFVGIKYLMVVNYSINALQINLNITKQVYIALLTK